MEKLLNIEQFFAQNSFESKLKIIGEFGYTFGILGKTLWVGFTKVIFLRPKVFEQFLSLKGLSNNKTCFGIKIRSTTSSHLG
jgi:hypothetical protein